MPMSWNLAGARVRRGSGREENLREGVSQGGGASACGPGVRMYAAKYIGNERGQMIYLTGPVVWQGVLGLVGEGWESLRWEGGRWRAAGSG
jgi:hypothetical protein